MIRTLLSLAAMFSLLGGLAAQEVTNGVEIVLDKDATWLERMAAQEVRRYSYARSGSLLQIRSSDQPPAAGNRIVVGTRLRPVVLDELKDDTLRGTLEKLEPQHYVISMQADGDRKALLLVGGDGVGTLYAAYRFAEQLGVRFYLHGDVVPDEQVPLQLGEFREVGRPLFETRGIQPFHDFPEGPDWWDTEAYKAVLSQLPKMRMNFIGLHTYPEGGVGPEPTVWIGPPDELADDGSLLASYPSRHFVTRNVTGAWGYRPQDTGDYAFGAAEMYERDNYGADYMRGTFPWNEMDQEKSNALFQRFADVLKESFGLAHKLGIKTCVGTETPLIIPQLVRERLLAAGKQPADAATVQQVYEGMFRRIMAAYDIDYYWLWTPEGWTWGEVKQDQIDATLADFQAVRRAAEAVKAPFQLATCGWVLGPPQQPALFDSVLPKSWPLSCINRNVGHDPVEPGFAAVQGRPQWAIPWLEDDPALIIPQLWVGRMRKDAADALRYGCDGLLGIHWRTRILGPNVSALAHAAWTQDGWKTDQVDRNPPPLEGTFDDRRLRYPVWRQVPSDDFFTDWSMSQFGARAGMRIAPVFARLDGRLPRPANWVNGPGGIVPDARPWSTVSDEYRFVDELTDLRPLVQGAGNLERFDYWLNNFKYMRAMARLNCTWSELNAVLDALKQAESVADRKELVTRKVIPLRIRLIRELSYVQDFLLQTVTNLGEMGTVTNWQQHVFPLLLDASEKAITEVTGEPLTGKALLPREYTGQPRMFVPVVRTVVFADEPLKIDAISLGGQTAVAVVHWRPLGEQSFKSAPMSHVNRGVYRASIPAADSREDFEYYVEFVTTDQKSLRFPPTAPELNQTVVRIVATD